MDSLTCIYDEITDSIVESFYGERKLILNDLITDDLIEWFCLSILKWNREDKHIPIDQRKKIYVYINSGGGDLITGRQILDCIKMSETPVVTVGLAQCASMASYILAAGHERYCFPSTVLLYHDGTQGVYSTSNKAKDTMAFYTKLDDDLEEFILDVTNMDKEFLDSIKDREYYMFSDEIKELGIVDGIVGKDVSLNGVL